MKKIIASIFVFTFFAVSLAPAHQSIASNLKGEVADLMPDHVVGEQPGNAHQSGASDLKGGVADLVPGHVRK